MESQLKQAIRRESAYYDEKEHMLAYDRGGHTYHSHYDGRVHRTSNSLMYAAALLRVDELPDRADAVIRRVMGLQDRRADSPTYGLWPWYLEEPLERMAPPDYNWADFCGKALLAAVMSGYDRETVREAVLAACACIIRRDVQPGYTNIAVMGAYVTLLAGQVYGREDIFSYGKRRLKKLEDYGCFDEYNSPAYTTILMEELTNIRRYIEDPVCVEMADRLLDKAWRMTAEHFHPETLQWAGPMARAYSTLLTPETYAQILCAVYGPEADCGGAVMGIASAMADIRCPEKYRGYFEKTEKPRFIAEDINGGGTAFTYITPDFSLGSFRVSDMWNQKRPLLAFWGDWERPSYLALRVLHDGFDYCAATLRCVQDRGHVEGVLTFETEGGDTHPSLDRIRDGKITASDLRIVFEFHNSEPKYVDVRRAVFDGQPVRPERTARGLEFVLYSGAEREIDFSILKESEMTFTVDM